MYTKNIRKKEGECFIMEKVIINPKEAQKGITLIALVITIIVLLILAGVSIAMLTGQNGILTQAQNAKTTNESKSAEEKVKLAVMGARADDGTLTVGKLRTELANYGGTVEGNTFPVTATVDGKSFTVDDKGNVELAGEIILVTDNPDRENEGDMICAGEFATQENINFMASYAKGLICTPMSGSMAAKLGFPPMVAENTDNHSTAFTIAIDHVETTTGISAAERSFTIMKCCDENSKPEDFRHPGHVFPLVAREGGVLVRNGHTEATVDLMKLAGLKECGVCCEIMEDDGTMMRTPNLWKLAEKYNLKFITINDLQNYIRIHVKHVEKMAEAKLPTKYGEFRIAGYVNDITKEHHVALIKGDIGDGENVLCRVHSECLTGDVFGSSRCDCGEQLESAIKQIEKEGRGIVLYMRQEGRGIGLINKLMACGSAGRTGRTEAGEKEN